MGSLREVRGEIEIPPPPLGPSGAGRETEQLAKEKLPCGIAQVNFFAHDLRRAAFSSFSRKGSEKVAALSLTKTP